MLRAMLPRTARSAVLSLVCVSLSGLAACLPAYGEVRQVIRAQFAADLSCPEVELKRRDVWYSYDGPDQYKVSGCGKIRTYTCPAGDGMASYDEPVCKWVDGDLDAPQMAKLDGENADESAPPMEGDGEPMDADEELDAQEPAADEPSEPSSSLDEPAPAADAPAPPKKKPAAKGGVKASGGLKLGGGAGKKK